MALTAVLQGKIDRLGKNQRHVLDCLAGKGPYPGYGWTWASHSETVRMCESLVKHGLVTTRLVTGTIPARNHVCYEALPEIVMDRSEREAVRAAMAAEQRRAINAVRDRAAAEKDAQDTAKAILVARHAEEFEALLAEQRELKGLVQTV